MAPSSNLQRLLPLLPLLLLLPLSGAHPDGFVINTTLAPTCTSHPSLAYFQTYSAAAGYTGPAPYARHQAPQDDASTSIALLDADNVAVQSVCPGATYNLSVTFPGSCQWLVTASAGDLTTADPLDPLNCTNRFISYSLRPNTPHTRSPMATAMLTLPCYDQMPGGALVIRASRANASSDYFMQAVATLPANYSCGVGACFVNASTASPPPEPPSPPPPPPSTPFVASPSPPSPPTSTTDLACAPSSLGYSCSFAPSGTFVFVPIVVHWSVNTPPPSNVCTGQQLAGGAAVNGTEGVIHMAFQARTSGYVGLGFSSASSSMMNSDVVFGWVDAGPQMVDVWFTGSGYYSMTAENAVRPSWVSSRGIAQTTNADGTTTTTLCFSRRLSAASAAVSSVLRPSHEVTMIFAAADDGVIGFGVEHKTRGGFTLNLGTGITADLAVVNRVDKLNIHGALMAVAWVLLLPLGTLFARHKWLLGETKLFGLHLWFQLHQGLQLSGMVLFIVGFAYGWLYLPGPNQGNPVGGDAGKAHEILGTIIMGLAGLQVILGATRPKPDASWRPQWNAVHHNLGRLTLLSAWVTIYLGIYIAHGSLTYELSYSTWLVPVAVVMGAMVAADVVLTILSPRVPDKEAGVSSNGDLSFHSSSPRSGSFAAAKGATPAPAGSPAVHDGPPKTKRSESALTDNNVNAWSSDAGGDSMYAGGRGSAHTGGSVDGRYTAQLSVLMGDATAEVPAAGAAGAGWRQGGTSGGGVQGVGAGAV